MQVVERNDYDSNVSDEEWAIIEPMLEQEKPTAGRPMEYAYRDIINGIFYLLKTGCQWRALPHDFPPYDTVYYHYNKWKRNGFWQRLNQALVEQLRQATGRDEDPTAVIIDSQSVKGTPENDPETVGVDGNKKVKGRKRHIIVDANGFVLVVKVHPANENDGTAGIAVIQALLAIYTTISLIWADGTYQAAVKWAEDMMELTVEIVKNIAKGSGFKRLLRRWVVERTFAWLGRYRRLSRDYERRTDSSESMVYIASIRHLVSLLVSPARLEKFSAVSDN